MWKVVVSSLFRTMIHRFIAADRLIAAPLFIRLIFLLFHFLFAFLSVPPISIPRLNDPRPSVKRCKKKKKEKASCVERAAKGCRVGEGEKRGKRGRRRGAGERVD